MAQDTHIKYQGKGFWISECYIELLSQYICEVFESIGLNTFNQDILSIYEDCDVNRKGVNYGMVNILLDEYITNSTDKANLISVLNQTKSHIQSIGSEISISQLNQFENNKTMDEFKSPWTFTVKTQSLIATLDLIIQILNGTYSENNTDIQYIGSPGGTTDSTFI